MAHAVHDENGVAYAGDPDLSPYLKDRVDNNPGHYVVDSVTGKIVYPSSEEEEEEEE